MSKSQSKKKINSLFVNIVSGKIGIMIPNSRYGTFLFYTYNSDEEQQNNGLSYSTEDVNQQELSTIYVPINTITISDQILFSVDDAINNFDDYTKEQLLDVIINQNIALGELIEQINNQSCAIIMSEELNDKINKSKKEIVETENSKLNSDFIKDLSYDFYIKWTIDNNNYKYSYSEWLKLVTAVSTSENVEEPASGSIPSEKRISLDDFISDLNSPLQEEYYNEYGPNNDLIDEDEITQEMVEPTLVRDFTREDFDVTQFKEFKRDSFVNDATTTIDKHFNANNFINHFTSAIDRAYCEQKANDSFQKIADKIKNTNNEQ